MIRGIGAAITIRAVNDVRNNGQDGSSPKKHVEESGKDGTENLFPCRVGLPWGKFILTPLLQSLLVPVVGQTLFKVRVVADGELLKSNFIVIRFIGRVQVIILRLFTGGRAPNALL